MALSDFLFYFKLGWLHIISIDALDHQLFILALVAVYTAKNVKQVLILVTAFTIGHSLTLLLSVLDVIRFSSKWVEFLIPCTIVITAISNLFKKPTANYYLA
ncbi:MAG: HupE/UreJ family protein, partial [Pedobacter sp.]|nr:HupE/UreJ family protein [Pedobacter sp.]